MFAAQPNVELKDPRISVVLDRDQSGAALCRHHTENEVVVIRFGLVREIDAGEERVEKAAPLNYQTEVGSLHLTLWIGYRAWSDGFDPIHAYLEVCGGAAEPSELLIKLDVEAIVDRVAVAPARIGLPDLDQGVANMLALAV